MDKKFLKKLNKKITAKGKTKPAVINPGNLDYATTAKKPEDLMARLIHGHCFADGNKRTALAATQIYLRRKGTPLKNLTPKETFKFLKQEANQTYNTRRIQKWLKKH